MTPEEYLASVLAQVSPLPPTEVALGEALGLVNVAQVVSPIDLPVFDNSAMDGYAVRAGELAGAAAESPITMPVSQESGAAGQWPPPLPPGQVAKVMTGAPIPAGADAVVPYEWTDSGAVQVVINGAPEVGRHFRRAGEDVRQGTPVLEPGTRLTARHLGLLASIGASTVTCRPRPRVLVVSTGSELTEPGQPLAPGAIYDSNSVMLASLLTQAGARPRRLGFIQDDPDEFWQALEPELAEADLVVTSGGVSMGDFDVVKAALTSRGVSFTRVDMQPGKPQGFGFLTDVPVVTLPGNPVSSFVSFEVFVRPVVRQLLGLTPQSRPVRRAVLSEAISSPEGKVQFLRAQLTPTADGETLQAKQVGGPGSHLLAKLAESNGLLIVPADVTSLAAGAEVSVLAVDEEF